MRYLHNGLVDLDGTILAMSVDRTPQDIALLFQKGRWVERILSRKHTCRMHGIPTFPRLVQAISD